VSYSTTSIVAVIDDIQVVNHAPISQSKEKVFTDSDLTVAGLLVWNHGLNSVPIAIRVIQDAIGEDWNVPYQDLSPDILTLDFAAIRPLPGTWRVLIIPS
jgi:hypothetical protein